MKRFEKFVICCFFVMLVVIVGVFHYRDPGFVIGEVTICGYSEKRIKSMDVGIYEVTVKQGESEYPANIIVYKLSEKKYYVLKYEPEGTRICLDEYLFD